MERITDKIVGKSLPIWGRESEKQSKKLMSNEKKENTTSFTVDGEVTGINEMPSVTRLLNRKSLKLGQAAKPAKSKTANTSVAIETASGEASAIPVPSAAIELSPPLDSTQVIIQQAEAPQPQSKPEPVKLAKVISLSTRASSRRTPSTQTLVTWERTKLAQTKDPVATSITLLFEKKKLVAALLLPSQGANRFVANAMIALNQQRLTPSLWSGLCFDNTIVPEVWKLFTAEGWVELPPPGTKTSITSARNVLRGAFGIKQDETLNLFRVGPAAKITGILACITSGSVSTEVKQLVKMLSVASP